MSINLTLSLRQVQGSYTHTHKKTKDGLSQHGYNTHKTSIEV